MEKSRVDFRPAKDSDLETMEGIRAAAFAPVFESFRSLLGETLYALAQEKEDAEQAGMLPAMLEPDFPWCCHVAECNGEIVGFIAIRADKETLIGEIGLNAVHPGKSGQGIGTAMYEFGIAELRKQGMKVATVATGGDDSHAAARRAYRKAGFHAQVPSVWMCRLI